MKFLAKMSMGFMILFTTIFMQEPLLHTNTAHALPGNQTILFPESIGQTKSRTITIPNLYRVDNISIDNGNVSYSMSGDQLTVTVSNGDWITRESYYDPYKYSRYETAYRSSYVNSFSSSYTYNSGGYSGTLTRNGSSYWWLGEYRQAHTRYESGSKRISRFCPAVNGGSVACESREDVGIYYTYPYNSGGYSGVLEETYYNYSEVREYDSNGKYLGYTWTRYQTYGGWVTRPGIDTRIYRQDYGGYVYMGGTSYRNHTYAYEVTVNYTTNVPPILTIATGMEDSSQHLAPYHGYSELVIEGSVYDLDNDPVTVTASVAGYSKSTTLTNTNITQSFSIPLIDLLVDDIPNGIHTVTVTARDDKNASDTKTFNIKVRDIVTDNTYVLVDEWIMFLTKYTDYENDPMYQEQFKFAHHPEHFENSDRKIGDANVTRSSPYEQTGSGPISDSGKWRDTAYDSLSRVGKYDISYRAQDNPKSDNRFAEFRKWSEPTPPLTLYVHRKPVADFRAYIKNSTGEVAVADLAYDLDRYSNGNRGIKEKWWRYRQVGSSSWIDGKPETLSNSQTWELEQRVLDFQGEYDTYFTKIEAVNTIPNLPPIPGFTHESPYYIGDTIKITSTATDPDGDFLTYEYTVNKPDGTTEIYTHDDPEMTQDGHLTLDTTDNGNEVGDWEIIQSVTDGIADPVTYSQIIEVKDLEIQGFVDHTEGWIERHIELGTDLTAIPKKFYSGEEFLLEAHDPAEQEKEKIEVFLEGKQTTGSSLKLKSELSKESAKVWKGSLYDETLLEPGLTSGYVTFTFVAHFKNGTIREDTVICEIIGNSYEAYDYHRAY